MKGAFQYMQKELNKIKRIKVIDDPFLYMNSLLKLFNEYSNSSFVSFLLTYQESFLLLME